MKLPGVVWPLSLLCLVLLFVRFYTYFYPTSGLAMLIKPPKPGDVVMSPLLTEPFRSVRAGMKRSDLSVAYSHPDMTIHEGDPEPYIYNGDATKGFFITYKLAREDGEPSPDDVIVKVSAAFWFKKP